MIPFALNHVWQSTVFAGVIALAALALRKHSARARFWLWTFASLKFLVPFAILAVLGSHLPRRAAPPATEPPTGTLTKLAQPFASADVAATQLSPLSEQPARSSSESWTPRLFALWLVGFGSTLGWRLVQSLRLGRTRGAARPAAGALDQLPIPVLLTDGSIEPGVLGVFRPVLLLPTSIAERLNPAQLQAVVAHELVHVRRRDNLWADLHAFVQAIFWFHPLVWWMEDDWWPSASKPAMRWCWHRARTQRITQPVSWRCAATMRAVREPLLPGSGVRISGNASPPS